MTDEEYRVIKGTLLGTFTCGNEKREEKSAIIKCYRIHDKLTLDADGNLLFEGRRVVTKAIRQ